MILQHREYFLYFDLFIYVVYEQLEKHFEWCTKFVHFLQTCTLILNLIVLRERILLSFMILNN